MDKRFIILKNYNNIKELMKQRHISFGQLARRTHYSIAHVHRIINGKAKMTETLLIDLSRIFKKGINELYYGGDTI